MADVTSKSAEEATKDIDITFEKYDHLPPYTPTPTFTMTPTTTISQSITPTPSMTVTPSNTISITPTVTESSTVTPTVSQTWTVYQEFVNNVEDFVQPPNGTHVDFSVCPCIVEDANESTCIFALKRYDIDKANKTLVVRGEWYEIVSSYTTFSKDVLQPTGESTTQVGFFMNNSLLIPKNTDIDMFVLFHSNSFYELEYTGSEQIYNTNDDIIPVNHDPLDINTYIEFTKKTNVEIYGYRLLKQRESRIVQSVEDVAPQIGFAIKTNDYAYTYVFYVSVTHGTDNIEIDMITRNDVIVAMNGENVVGVSSIRTTTTTPSRIAVQVHTNTMEDEYITFKLLKHTNLYMYTLGGMYINIQGGTHTFRVGYTRKELKAPYDYVSINSGSTRSMLGTYFKSIIQVLNSVRSQQGVLIKTNNGFVGTLRNKTISYTLSANTFYILNIQEDIVWEYVGAPMLNNNVSYTIEEGENWISHPDIENIPFSSFTGIFTNLTSVKTQHGMMTFDSGGWNGGISIIEPNEGYIVTSERTYDVIRTLRHYSTIPIQIQTQFDVILDDIPAQITIIDETNVHVNIYGVQFQCESKQEYSYYDSNLLTIVPTLFESTNDVEANIGDYTAIKIKGVLSFTLAYSNEMYDTNVSGFLDMWVHMGDFDEFTGDDPEMSWLSDIRGDNGYVIKKI